MRRSRALLLTLALALPGVASAEFRSIADSATILYDAPSLHAAKLFVVSRGLPVELISTDGTWIKVRDATGGLAWVERKATSDKRTVLVKVPTAAIHERADEQSPLAFQARQGVVLDLLDAGTSGWAHVKHADGASGYVRLNQVWGL
jgi:SH3-like domain-containing protein